MAHDESRTVGVPVGRGRRKRNGSDHGEKNSQVKGDMLQCLKKREAERGENEMESEKEH